MYRLTYQDNYHVERTLEYKDYEELMLSLSGCVTLPDTHLIKDWLAISTDFFHKLIFQIKTNNFLSFFLFLLIFSQCFYKIEE